MVYSSRFVMSILVDGKPQKELANGVIPIPFGKQYAIRFRNKHNRRAVVKFTIDNENVSGEGYIVPANSSIDILRHHHKDAAFKFVDLDSPEAVDYGKNGPNTDGSKGVIEARFYLEKSNPNPVVKKVEHHYHYWPQLSNPYVPHKWEDGTTWCSTNTSNKCDSSVFPGEIPSKINLVGMDIPPTINCTFPPTQFCSPLQEGCTVEGNYSGQTFVSEHIDLETDYVLLRCVLKGFVATTQAIEQITNVTYCTNCGAKKARQADNFCGVCGKKF